MVQGESAGQVHAAVPMVGAARQVHAVVPMGGAAR